MNKFPTYNYYLKTLLVTTFFGFLLNISTPYIYYLLESGADLFELVDHEDGETEKEEEKSEKDEDDKVRTHHLVPRIISSNPMINISLSVDFLSFHYPEIHTPPPDQPFLSWE